MTMTTRAAYSLGAAGLAEGTNANTFKTSNILHYAINGRTYVKAATDNLAFSSGHTALGNSEQCVFFVFLDSSGTVSTTQSAVVKNTTHQSYVAKAVEWPQVANKACIGAIRVQCNASGTFTPTSTDLGAANVTDTYYDVGPDMGVPIEI